ncbi:MAG: 6-phosphofructokinase [Candidatus Erginobacter occultus]|nr:6-phosphofructokinase [Candidatus Erginobacter occultus]
MVKRIIVGESGGPTPVIDWEVAGVVDAAQKAGIEVYGMFNGLEGLLNANIEGNIVDLSRINAMAFTFTGPGAGLRTTRIKPKPDQYRVMARNLDALGIDGVVYIGGNDSADQLLGLTAECGVKAIHAIKTVDNDLPVTHHCPGYGSATLYNAIALKNVHSDFSSYRVWGNYKINGEVVSAPSIIPVVIYQVMGRKAGWLAQGTAFAKVDPMGDIRPDYPPHIILSKEIPFDREEFLAELEKVISRQGEAVIVVQEDLTDKKTGKSLAEIHSGNLVTDDHGNIQHGRAESFAPCIFLAGLIKQELKIPGLLGKIKEAVLAPQHIQRSNLVSRQDACEAYMVGFAAVKAMLDGAHQKSVILEKIKTRVTTNLTDLANIAARERKVPLEFINGLEGPTQEFIDEYIYTIGGAGAIPHYSYRKFVNVPIPDSIGNDPYLKGEDEYKWPLKKDIIQ